MRIGMHSLSLMLAAACGGELPSEEAGALSTYASSLESCSPDVTPPEVECQPEAGIIECFGYGYLTEPSNMFTASDNCGLTSVNGIVFPVNGVGTYTANISATDAANHLAQCSTKWTVVDTRPPILTLNGPAQQVLPIRSSYGDQGATGRDTCDGWDLDRRIERSGSVDVTVPGTYPVTYTLSDQAGHTTRRTRLVTVLPASSCAEQLTAPVLVLQGSSEELLECGRETWTDPGAMAADACGALTVHSYNSGQDEYGPGPNSKAEGRYLVQYLAWNSQEMTSALRTVIVQDTTPPTLDLKGAMHLTHTCGSPWVDPGYTAQDSCYGDVSYSVQVTGSVNGWAEGRYTVFYEARDPGGRRSNILKRTVDVVDCPW